MSCIRGSNRSCVGMRNRMSKLMGWHRQLVHRLMQCRLMVHSMQNGQRMLERRMLLERCMRGQHMQLGQRRLKLEQHIRHIRWCIVELLKQRQ